MLNMGCDGEAVCERDAKNFNVLHAFQPIWCIGYLKFVFSSFVHKDYFIALTKIKGEVIGNYQQLSVGNW